MVLETKQL